MAERQAPRYYTGDPRGPLKPGFYTLDEIERSFNTQYNGGFDRQNFLKAYNEGNYYEKPIFNGGAPGPGGTWTEDNGDWLKGDSPVSMAEGQKTLAGGSGRDRLQAKGVMGSRREQSPAWQQPQQMLQAPPNSKGRNVPNDPALVKQWQSDLVSAGYLPAVRKDGKSNTDGIMGPDSKSATMLFQASVGEKPTGVVGDVSRSAMQTYQTAKAGGAEPLSAAIQDVVRLQGQAVPAVQGTGAAQPPAPAAPATSQVPLPRPRPDQPVASPAPAPAAPPASGKRVKTQSVGPDTAIDPATGLPNDTAPPAPAAKPQSAGEALSRIALENSGDVSGDAAQRAVPTAKPQWQTVLEDTRDATDPKFAPSYNAAVSEWRAKLAAGDPVAKAFDDQLKAQSAAPATATPEAPALPGEEPVATIPMVDNPAPGAPPLLPQAASAEGKGDLGPGSSVSQALGSLLSMFREPPGAPQGGVTTAERGAFGGAPGNVSATPAPDLGAATFTPKADTSSLGSLLAMAGAGATAQKGSGAANAAPDGTNGFAPQAGVAQDAANATLGAGAEARSTAADGITGNPGSFQSWTPTGEGASAFGGNSPSAASAGATPAADPTQSLGATLAALNAQLAAQAAAQGYDPSNPNMTNAPF